MSLSTPEDPDPLLAFPTEPGGTAAKPPDSLLTRVANLERALEESKSQAAAMRSELATLVRTVSDIRRQSSRPIAASSAAKPVASASRSGVAAAIAGLIIGASVGVFGWIYLSGNADLTIAAPPVAAIDTRGLAPTVVEANSVDKIDHGSTVDGPRDVQGLAPTVVRTNSVDKRDSRGQPPNVPNVTYVGTLSIDSDPGGDVFLNRKSAGHTPLRLTNLRAGSHLIWVERDGYRRWTRVVHVPADRVTRLSAELEPIAAR